MRLSHGETTSKQEAHKLKFFIFEPFNLYKTYLTVRPSHAIICVKNLCYMFPELKFQEPNNRGQNQAQPSIGPPNFKQAYEYKGQ